MTTIKKTSQAEEYKEMEIIKNPYMDRFREYSRMTLKYLAASEFLDVELDSSSDQHGWSSLGGELADYLANKIVMLMYPPEKDFFQMEPTFAAKEELLRLGASEPTIELLMMTAQSAAKELDDIIDPRTELIELMKHLIVGGNVLVKFTTTGWQLTSLTNYCVSKNLAGDIQTLIFVERQPIGNYTKDQQKIFKNKYSQLHNVDDSRKINLFTKVKLVENKYHITQSVDESVVLQKVVKVNKLDLPYYVVGWNTVTTPYSSSKIELHAGGFNALEILEEAITKGAVLFSDIKTFIDPAAMVDLEEMIDSEFGSYHYGRENDVHIAQVKNTLGSSYVQSLVDSKKRELSRSFLYQNAARRDAERVTSYEIRLDAIESEVSLGGAYSRLVKSCLKPYARFLIANSAAKAVVGDIVPVVTTGLDALGKSVDLQKLVQWSETMQLTQTWPQELIARTDMYLYSLHVANRLGFELNFIMNEKEWAEFQAKEQAKQQQNMAVEQVSKGAGQAAGRALVEGETNGG